MDDRIDVFVDEISALHEVDFRNFKRAASGSLARLSEKLVAEGNRNILDKVDEMKRYSQIGPDGDVDLTKIRLINDAKYINDLIKAQKQDWESPDPPGIISA